MLPIARRHVRHLLIAMAVLSASPQAQPAPDCGPRDSAAIVARERAAAEWPKALLPQIELAACYDKAWRFQQVQPAIAKAAALLDAEIAAAPPKAPEGVRPVAGEGVPLPRRTKDMPADYPTKALVAGVTGTVILELVVDPKGNVREARAVSSLPALDDAAVKAAKKWKYEPTLVAGQPTEILTYAAVRFGQAMEPIPADWLAMAAFHYKEQRLKLARGSLDAAIGKSRADQTRFGTYIPGSHGIRAAETPPVKTKHVAPGYPTGALSYRIQGLVLIEALLDAQGNVGRAYIVSKPSVLDASALEAVLQWKFMPAMTNGSPVAVAMTVTVNFSLR